jgi:ABC-2 type transport system permease protein
MTAMGPGAAGSTPVPATAPGTPDLGSPAWGGFDPARAEGTGADGVRRSFVTAARLGWAMEANWTDPVLFIIYSVARPVSAALILVVMLDIISGGTRPEYRGFIVVGTAMWSFVIAGIAGLAWSVLDDRERYRMLKYVYVSPSDFLVVLLGRGVARVAVGAMGTIITIGVGIIALGVSFDVSRIDWPLLAVVMVLGVGAIVAIGIILAAICLQTRQESWSYPDAVAGALFLVSGAVFPLSVLPAVAQAIGLATPLTWWIEGVRLALSGGGLSAIGGPGSLWTTTTGTAAPDRPTIVLALLATGALVTLAATVIFHASERRAKDRGLLDQTTGS